AVLVGLSRGHWRIDWPIGRWRPHRRELRGTSLPSDLDHDCLRRFGRGSLFLLMRVNGMIEASGTCVRAASAVGRISTITVRLI
ncbi:MAG TPA: hypothetical protein VLJ17_14025, partial [Xanthobacteraceae bacterium]|nr:hypothetical protein [Xanthobacteraceae bacterium]